MANSDYRYETGNNPIKVSVRTGRPNLTDPGIGGTVLSTHPLQTFQHLQSQFHPYVYRGLTNPRARKIWDNLTLEQQSTEES